MSELKMPELNSVLVAGNLTKDPVFRETSNKTPVVNFSIAANRKYKDSSNQWQEDVCYVGVVAWNKLAESCKDRLKKGSAVLIEGELQSRTWKTEDGQKKKHS
jgi:single-strand DNA-binding protein